MLGLTSSSTTCVSCHTTGIFHQNHPETTGGVRIPYVPNINNYELLIAVLEVNCEMKNFHILKKFQLYSTSVVINRSSEVW